MEGIFLAGLLLMLGVGVLRELGALGVDAHPAAMGALENVSEDAFFVYLGGAHLVVHQVGAIGHRDVSHHAYGDHLLLKMEGFVLAGDQLCQLLVARGDVATGRNVYKQRG